MIEEALPKNSDGSTKEGVFATIATKEMMIISSSYEKHEIGSYLNLDSSYFTLNPGESISEIIVYEGKYFALGVKCSKGYREYKSTKDEYINNIYAFFFSFISDVSDTIINKEDALKPQKEITFNRDANSVDIATFMIGKQWFGIETKDVVEAISVDELKSTIKIDPNHHFKGTLIYQDKVVMVIDIKKFLQENIMDEYKEIIIIKYGTPQTYLGILVNGLEDISEVNINNIKTLNNEIIGEGTLIESVIFPDDNSSSKDVLSILSVDKIVKNLVRSEETRLIYKMVS
jgi:chemotaxis signal transduction protein